jgi:hypothetical protein
VPHSVYTGRAKSRTVRSPRRQCGTLCLRFTYEEGKAGRFTYPVSPTIVKNWRPTHSELTLCCPLAWIMPLANPRGR